MNKNFIISPQQLRSWELLPLSDKVELAKERIKSWYEAWDGNVYVSFSGGKDSTVLLHLVRSLYPEVLAVFLNTGLEFPEVSRFAKSVENVVIVHPKLPFHKVIEQYGYPVVSKETSQKISEIRTTKSDYLRDTRLNGKGDTKNGKVSEKWKFLVEAPFKISHKCCAKLKKEPIKRFGRESGLKPFIGTMATDSRLREQQYLLHGCNSFDSKNPRSVPISFFLEKDIWEYLYNFNVPYSSIYDMGYTRTGCMFCMFGIHMEKEDENRFQRMSKTHPQQYKYCIENLGVGRVLDFLKILYV